MTPGPPRRATASIATLLAASATTLLTLLAFHPELPAKPSAWTGDDLAFASMWLVALGCATWLTAATLACLTAMTRGRHASARRIAGWAPPVARQILQSALVGTWALLPVAAYAAPAPPLTLHVGPGGRLVPVAEGARSHEVPVVRTPPTTSTTSTTIPPATTTNPARFSEPASPQSPARSARPARARPQTTAGRAYVVRAGDNLWRIARSEIVRTTGISRPDDRAIAPYWQRVIAANRATLRSGNPSLIFPGEIVNLPTD